MSQLVGAPTSKRKANGILLMRMVILSSQLSTKFDNNNLMQNENDTIFLIATPTYQQIKNGKKK